MIDLRLHANNLIGTEIEAPVMLYTTAFGVTKNMKQTVIRVYPHFIMCARVTENGTVMRECYNIGDLVHLGILHGGGEQHG